MSYQPAYYATDLVSFKYLLQSCHDIALKSSRKAFCCIDFTPRSTKINFSLFLLHSTKIISYDLLIRTVIFWLIPLTHVHLTIVTIVLIIHRANFFKLILLKLITCCPSLLQSSKKHSSCLTPVVTARSTWRRSEMPCVRLDRTPLSLMSRSARTI